MMQFWYSYSSVISSRDHYHVCSQKHKSNKHWLNSKSSKFDVSANLFNNFHLIPFTNRARDATTTTTQPGLDTFTSPSSILWIHSYLAVIIVQLSGVIIWMELLLGWFTPIYFNTEKLHLVTLIKWPTYFIIKQFNLQPRIPALLSHPDRSNLKRLKNEKIVFTDAYTVHCQILSM